MAALPMRLPRSAHYHTIITDVLTIITVEFMGRGTGTYANYAAAPSKPSNSAWNRRQHRGRPSEVPAWCPGTSPGAAALR